MKRNLHFYLIVLFASISTSLLSQLPNGSVAPDFTLTDINGVTYNLYDELNDGKSIVLDISATWCPPCWNYHNNGPLEALYEDFGPDGTDQIRVFFVEGEDVTNLACLYGTAGCNNSTMGDWVTGTQYPIFSPSPTAANNFISDYQLNSWPTLYGISPIDKTTVYLGQASYGQWESWLIDSWQMSASATTTDSDCPFTGSIDLDVNLGFGSLNYDWSNGDTSEDLEGVPAGTYSVTITDAHNVDITLDNLIVGGTSAPALSVAFLSGDDVDCNGNSTGSLGVLASGGTGSFSYEWDNGMVGSFIDNLSQGDYEVTATDGFGCEVMKVYTVGEPELLTLGSSITGTACGEENGLAYIFGEGGVTPYTYDIGFGGQFNSSFPSLPSGNYTAKITDNNGCITEQPFTIDASVAPVAIAEVDGAINCNNVEVAVSAASSTSMGNVDYVWSTSDGEIQGSNEQETIMAVAPGTYSVDLIETSTGCMSSAEIVVEDNSSLPTVAIADTEIIDCTISQVVIDGSMSDEGTNLSYAWTSADGNIIGESNTASIEVDQGGTYTLSIINSDSGCSASQSVTVEADVDIPTITVPSLALTCDAPEVQLCATIDEGNTVKWSTDNGEVSQTCITVSLPGDYTATVEAPNGCTSTAVSSVTATNDLPVVSILPPSVITCTQESVPLEIEIDGEQNNTILWTDADGIIIAEGLQEIMVSEPGVYQVSVTNASGCVTMTSVSVEQDINAPLSAFDYSLDADGVVMLTSTSADGGSITWTLSDGTTSSGDEATFSLSESGEYEVCMTYANECGSDENCQTIVYSTSLAVSIDKSDLSCFGSSDGSIAPLVSGGASGYTFYWIGSNGFESTEANISGLAAGTYNLVINDDDGTEISTEVTLTEPEELRATEEEVMDVSCNGGINGNLNISIVGGTGAYSYLWSDGSTESNRSGLMAGDYSLIVTDEMGCELDRMYTIQEPAALSLISVIASEETDGSLDGSIEVEVEGGVGELTYEWSNGATGASIDNLAAGEYSVVVTDANGCVLIEEDIEVGMLTDINEFDVVTDFFMYPVPTNSVLNVEATLNNSQAINMNILDARGESVWERSYTTTEIDEEIDLSELPSGIYTLSMITNNNIQSENFIVIK